MHTQYFLSAYKRNNCMAAAAHRQASSIGEKKSEISEAQSGLSRTIHEQGRRKRRKSITTVALTMLIASTIHMFDSHDLFLILPLLLVCCYLNWHHHRRLEWWLLRCTKSLNIPKTNPLIRMYLIFSLLCRALHFCERFNNIAATNIMISIFTSFFLHY